MSKKRQTSVQLTPATQRQVNDLQMAGFGSFTDIVRAAIDRMYQQEKDSILVTFEIKQLDGEHVATITYADGTMFTTGDWQSAQPQTLDDAPSFSWYKVDASLPVDTDRWIPAIWLNGRPVTTE